MAETDLPSAATLEYGTAPPLRQRRWFRWVVALCVVAVVGQVTWRYGGTVWRHAQVLWWQRACMAYARPANLLVYTDDPAEADKISRGEYIQMYRTGPAYYRDLPAYQGLSSLVGYDAGSGGATVYMHARKNNAGDRRLVIIYIRGAGTQRYLDVSVFAPATLTSRGKWLSRSTAREFHAGDANGAPLRLFAGQDDPNDPTAFVIPYEEGGVPGKLRGRLVGDNVALSPE